MRGGPSGVGSVGGAAHWAADWELIPNGHVSVERLETRVVHCMLHERIVEPCLPRVLFEPWLPRGAWEALAGSPLACENARFRVGG